MQDSTYVIHEPQPPLPDCTLEQLRPETRESLLKNNWEQLFPVQAKAIPYILSGKELIVQSKTGSGKTGAFLLPLLEILDDNHPHPQALIMVPTRELAEQVYGEFVKLTTNRNLRSVALYGGVGYDKQIRALREGCHLIIATPGRLLDFLQRGNLDFLSLRDMIIDEADEMLSMGFYPDMRRIRSYMPRRFCTTLFSATIPQTVKSLAREFQHGESLFLSLSVDKVGADTLEHFYYRADSVSKDRLLVQVLELENPQSCMIFCNMKKDVAYLGEFLQKQGFSTEILSGDIPQAQRQRTLNSFKERAFKILVSTDVAARGIDISEVSHVFMYDHPENPESYVHRSGRTGRAGKSGIAISIMSPLEEMEVKKIQTQFNIQFILKTLPAQAELDQRVRDRLVNFLERDKRSLSKSIQERIARYFPLIDQLGQDQDERELLALLLHEYYLKKIASTQE
jgi:ATP-dependent RNA helicase DeaD